MRILLVNGTGRLSQNERDQASDISYQYHAGRNYQEPLADRARAMFLVSLTPVLHGGLSASGHRSVGLLTKNPLVLNSHQFARVIY